MTSKPPALALLALVSALVVTAALPSGAEPTGLHGRGAYTKLRAQYAHAILRSSQISLLNYHVSGNKDQATALDNIVQTASGRPARRSYYGNGPGGSTVLDLRMLRAIYQLTREGYRFRITEIAGGSHSRSSRHYAGLAFDIDHLNGVKMGYGHPTYRRFIQRCRELGATQILGPGSPGHSSHVHIAWPKPKM